MTPVTMIIFLILIIIGIIAGNAAAYNAGKHEGYKDGFTAGEHEGLRIANESFLRLIKNIKEEEDYGNDQV